MLTLPLLTLRILSRLHPPLSTSTSNQVASPTIQQTNMTSPPPSIASFIAGQGDPTLESGSDESQAALLTCLSSLLSIRPDLMYRFEGYISRES